MLLQALTYPVVNKTMSSTDSLKHSLHLMQIKIDDLERTVIKTEIGTGFFSDALATNLSLFVAIIGLSAVVGWGYFRATLTVHKKSIYLKVNNEMSELKNELESKYLELTEKLQATIFDVNRAMYLSVRNDKDKYNAFGWSLACAEAAIDVFPNDFARIISWLKESERLLKTIEVGDKDLISDNHKYERMINKIEVLENEEVKTKIKAIKSDLYHLVYSKPQPPENIMENEVQTV